MKLALDTTHILGRGAVKDTYNLLADGIVQVLRGLARLGPFELLDVAQELGCTRYVQGSSLKGQADVDWTNPQARQRFLAEIVADAERMLRVVRGTRADLVADSAADKELVLARILGQDIERDKGGPRLKQGVASDRLISVHDPEMRHGRKSSSHRFNGHKAQIGVDTDSRLITGRGCAGGQCSRCRAGAGGGRGERSSHWLPGGGGAWRLCLWPRQHAGRIRGEGTDDRRQGARHQEPGVVRQDRVSDRSGDRSVYLPERTDHPRLPSSQKCRWDVRVLPPRPVRRARCGPSAREVRADVRCRSTRRKPRSSRRASRRPVRRSRKCDGGARWSSTA